MEPRSEGGGGGWWGGEEAVRWAAASAAEANMPLHMRRRQGDVVCLAVRCVSVRLPQGLTGGGLRGCLVDLVKGEVSQRLRHRRGRLKDYTQCLQEEAVLLVESGQLVLQT